MKTLFPAPLDISTTAALVGFSFLNLNSIMGDESTSQESYSFVTKVEQESSQTLHEIFLNFQYKCAEVPFSAVSSFLKNV